jgi:ribosomal protein S18 acetylase RimI-like enzyme
MEAQTGGLFRLSLKERAAGAAVLGRAFTEYELLRHYFPDESERHAAADRLGLLTVSICLKYGEVYGTSEKMEGVATWLPPGTGPLGGWQIMRSVPASVLLGLARGRAGEMRAYVRHINDLRRRLVPYPHWYLDMIGVDPPYQGQGFCSRLVRPILERIDREGTPCYLETNAEKNVGIYRRFGFEVISEDKVPGLELTTYAMLREGRRGEATGDRRE